MDHSAFYSALVAKDARFDGVFYVGVTSTGIYCRPVCTARTPRSENCRFFASPEAAERARFRPCLRCRPELAPGAAPVDDAGRIAAAIAQRLEQGVMEEGRSLEDVAGEFELSGRQIRRIVHREYGVSPIELVQTRRLLLAKQLLTDTPLPVAQVAFSSGFSSLRRFNDAFLGRYGIAPTRLRREAGDARAASDLLTLRIGYRPPLDWARILDFMNARAVPGGETVQDGAYARTLRLGGRTGWVRVRDAPEARALIVEVSPSLTSALPAVLARVRAAFDTSARPDVIAAHFASDPILGPAFARNPGIRLPGAFDGFELATRAVLGQQVTVASATRQAGRLAEAFGEEIGTPVAGLDRLAPKADALAAAGAEAIAAAGVVASRARAIVALAREVAGGRLPLHAGADPRATIERLTSLPGIGPWTAQYVAMRALRWPDAFPKEDVAVRRALGGVSPAEAHRISQPWRPWRSYAVMQLWGMGAWADEA